jgi:hypothetical protein
MSTDDSISGVSHDGGRAERIAQPWTPDGAPGVIAIGYLPIRSEAEAIALHQALLTATGGEVYGATGDQLQDLLARVNEMLIAIVHERDAAQAVGAEPGLAAPSVADRENS